MKAEQQEKMTISAPIFSIEGSSKAFDMGYEASGFFGLSMGKQSPVMQMKQDGLIDKALVSVNLSPGQQHYVKFGGVSTIGLQDGVKFVDAIEGFKVAAKDWTWGEHSLPLLATSMEVNLDSAYTFLPKADWQILVEHLT